MKPIKDPINPPNDLYLPLIRSPLCFSEMPHNYGSDFRWYLNPQTFDRVTGVQRVVLGFRVVLLEVEDETDKRS